MATAASTVIASASEAQPLGYFETCQSIAQQELNGENTTARIDACAAYFDVPLGMFEQDIAFAAADLASAR